MVIFKKIPPSTGLKLTKRKKTNHGETIEISINLIPYWREWCTGEKFQKQCMYVYFPTTILRSIIRQKSHFLSKHGKAKVYYENRTSFILCRSPHFCYLGTSFSCFDFFF
jgi:hypothetical protein